MTTSNPRNPLAERALAHAVRIARAAGERLRAELHRPGGPRGERGHAPIDAEVEDTIREALAAAFPEDGVRGEERPELNTQPRAGGGTWLVDPNDGTGPFLRRQRGASVSLGRVLDGQPVLGVVYAYAWPDDRGTLVAWAEGAGPLTVNGEPCSAEAAAPPVWWVSNTAERKATALAHALCVQRPEARFAPGPGIAFRLAQVAAGLGEVAVSVFAPRDFDVAGGHALVRGAGGEMVDARLRPQTYRADRPTQAASIFAGTPEATAWAAQTAWSTQLQAPDDAPHPLGPLAPGGAPLCADPLRLTRAQGAWLGLLVGSAAGAQFAGQPDAAGVDALRFARSLVRGLAVEAPAEGEAPLRGVALGLWSVARPEALAGASSAAQATVAVAIRQRVLGGGSTWDERAWEALAAEVQALGHRPDESLRTLLATQATDGTAPMASGAFGLALWWAFAGARDGLAALPPVARLAILTCRPIAGLPGVTHPTAPDAWPTDALVLAERLIVGPEVS